MFARKVYMHLKPNSADEFIQKIEKEIIPRLRKEKGFRDEIAFVAPSGKRAFAISLWDRKESAEAYDRGTYQDVLKSLSTLVEGSPRVKNYRVCNSTFHKIAVGM